MTTEVHDKAIAMLQATHDGDRLLPWQLKLLECAANDQLNDWGRRLFDVLHDRVLAGNYEEWTGEQALLEYPKESA